MARNSGWIATEKHSGRYGLGRCLSKTRLPIFWGQSSLNPTGTALLYTTYLGGTGGDFGLGIALDNSGSGANPGGNVYVTGETFSTDFPTTAANALKPGLNAGAALGTSFISKINPAASGTGSLVYSSYLGGTDGTSPNPDVGNAIAADVNGNAYVTGLTSSSPGSGLANFPITVASALQTTLGSSDGNAFLTRIDTKQDGGASLAYSTYLGGSGANAASSGLSFGEDALGVSVDSSENAYIVGITTSTDFPTTNTNAYQPNTAPPAAVAKGTVFVSRIDSSTTKTPTASLVYSTYLGGENQDFATAVALKPNSAVAYVTGETSSLQFPTFPTTPPGPYQATGSTGGTAFVSLIDTGQIKNAALTYSTFIGPPHTIGFGIAADATGNAYIGGGTDSTSYPVTPGAFQPAFAPGAQGEGFISKLNPGGKGAADLVYSSLFGGSGITNGPDSVNAIAVDSLNNAYLTGETFSSSATFPVYPPTAFQPSLIGLSDAFIAKLTLIPTLVVSPTALNFGTVLIPNTSPAQTVTLTNNTNAAITFTSAALTNGSPAAATTDYVVSANTCSGGIPTGAPPANQCTISVTFKPSVVGAETATLVLTDDDSTSPQNIALTGSGTNVAPDFTLTGPTSAQTVKDGQTLKFDVSMNPVGGFTSAVALSCSGAPSLATCTVNPTSVTAADGVTSQVAHVSMATTAGFVPPTRVPTPTLPARPLVPIVLALMLLISLRWARRPRLRLAMAAVLVLIAFAGCSGSPKPHTPKGPATLTITGTSTTPALTHTVQVQISVN